jgi:ABC-type phosphate transport system substrate-binding protein
MIALTLLFVTSVGASVNASEELVVVTNHINPVDSMTKSQVIDLFMGRHVAFPDGSKATPIDNKGEEQQRQSFYRSLVNMPIARVNSYWSRIRFTGRATPPHGVDSSTSIAMYIEQNPNAIGYIPRSMLNDKLKVVFEFDE